MHLDAPFAELLRDDLAGAHFLEADFGVRVEIAAPFGHFGVHLVKTFARAHARLPVAASIPVGRG